MILRIEQTKKNPNEKILSNDPAIATSKCCLFKHATNAINAKTVKIIKTNEQPKLSKSVFSDSPLPSSSLIVLFVVTNGVTSISVVLSLYPDNEIFKEIIPNFTSSSDNIPLLLVYLLLSFMIINAFSKLLFSKSVISISIEPDSPICDPISDVELIKVSEKNAVVVPIIKIQIRRIAATIGILVFGFILDKIVFLGSPCSSQEHSFSVPDLEGFGFIVNFFEHLGQMTSCFFSSSCKSNTNSWLHFGHIVLPFIKCVTIARYTY